MQYDLASTTLRMRFIIVKALVCMKTIFAFTFFKFRKATTGQAYVFLSRIGGFRLKGGIDPAYPTDGTLRGPPNLKVPFDFL